MNSQDSCTNHVTVQQCEDKPYEAPELRDLGALRETTLGEVSGNMEDGTMMLRTIV